MLIYRLIDYEKIMRRNKRNLIINDLPFETKEDRVIFTNTVVNVFNEVDILSDIPTCVCGYRKGGVWCGTICDKCGTVVNNINSDTVGITTWLRVPDGVISFLNPYVWLFLTESLNPKDNNIMEWVTDRNYKPLLKPKLLYTKRVQYLQSIGWKRGLNNLIENFETFIRDVVPELLFIAKKKGDYSELYDYFNYWLSNKHLTFTKYLPLPPKSMLVVESNKYGTYTDAKITMVLNTARIIASSAKIINPELPLTLNQIKSNERKAIKCQKGLASFNILALKNDVFGPGGVVRGSIIRNSTLMSGRSVITSLEGEVDYEECRLPWMMLVETMSIHISSALFNKGYSELEVTEKIENALTRYNVEIDEILTSFIGSAKREGLKGWPCITQRNPSLTRLSATTLYIPETKTRVTDKTIELPNPSLKGGNNDFDGDNNNVQVSPDKNSWKLFSACRIHYGLFSLLRPGNLNAFAGLTDPVIIDFYTWHKRFLNADAGGRVYGNPFHK